ncbi:branched-chain amino acid ABC transporter permease [Caballeronia sp. KNU42]
MVQKRYRFNLQFILPVALLLILLFVPFLARSADQPFYVTFFARIIIYAIAASALNLAIGYGGLVSLGHALFFGIGAFSVALPAFHGVESGWVHLTICIVACGSIGFVTGLISLRTSGIAFIMITLAFAQMGYFVLISLKQYGGDDGTPILLTSKFFSLDLGQPDTLYAVAFLVLCAELWWLKRVRASPFGMVLRGANENVRRINAVGLPAWQYQLVAYVLSAVLCGIAGFLLSNLNAFASPSTMSWVTSGDLMVMVVLGGLGTVFGPLLGALTFLGLEEGLTLFTQHAMVVLGPVVVIVVLLGDSGILGLVGAFDQWRRRHNRASGDPKPSVHVHEKEL